MKQLYFSIMNGDPAQVGDPWAVGDRCVMAKLQGYHLPDVGTILDLRHVPVAELPEDRRPRQDWISHVWRALVGYPSGLEVWLDLDNLCAPEEEDT